MSRIKTEAKIVDGVFIASFVGDNTGKIWRQEIAALSSSALEIRDMKDHLKLVAKKADGLEEDVFSFSDRANAVEALQVMTQALFQAADKDKPVVAKAGIFRRLLKAAVYLFVVAVCLILMTLLFHSIPAQQQSTATPKSTMPVPAEDILK